MAFGGFDKNNNNQMMSEINTTPLVDVMLVLLIIFMVTAPLITNSVNVNLPKTTSATNPEKPNVINVSIDEHDNLFWNGRKIDQAQLPALLKDSVNKKADSEIHIQADRLTPYQRITDLMSEAQKAGISKIGFISKVEK